MNHLRFVCSQNIRVTTEPIIVAALGVKKTFGAPYLFGLLRDLTFGDRRVWDTALKLIFMNSILMYYYICLDSTLTNDGRCTREIKYRFANAKATFNK
jgi:hypothetical protein